MRVIPRAECAILPLVLKGKWYDLIESGVKEEEYREAKPFWERRISKWLAHQKGHFDMGNKYIVVGFSRGYRKPDMFFMLRFCERREMSFNPAWGEPETEHFVLGLGERIEVE